MTVQVLDELLQQGRKPCEGQGAAHPEGPGGDGGQADGDAPEEDVLVLHVWGGGELGAAGQEEEDGAAAGGKTTGSFLLSWIISSLLNGPYLN